MACEPLITDDFVFRRRAAFQFQLRREAAAQGQRQRAPRLEGQRRAATDARCQAVAGEPYQLGNALAPDGGAQVGFVGVVLLVEGEDVAQDSRALQDRDAGVVGLAVRPGRQFGRGVNAAHHRLDEIGIAADAVGDARQAGPVAGAAREDEVVGDQRFAGHVSCSTTYVAAHDAPIDKP